MPSIAQLIALTPDDYRVIGPEDFGARGLVARESIGPFVPTRTLGALVTVHDSTFEPYCGIGHHPHQGMERLFYILEGAVDHDDGLNNITGHMGTGDLGILTEGRRGMIHSEWNNTDRTTRCYILVYPNRPLSATAAFDAIRDGDADRFSPAPGVATKQLVARGSTRLHGDVREFADHSLEAGATLALQIDAGEAGLIFVVHGDLEVDASGPRIGAEHTLALPPAPASRRIGLVAHRPSRILHAVTGPG